MAKINDKDYQRLIEKALSAREKAYCPYSKFAVGAALLTIEGKVYTGCNVENSAGTSNCAERTAFFKAVSEGDKKFAAIANAGAPFNSENIEDFCYPCGICRQVMSEFCSGDFIIISAKSITEYEVHTLSQMLPYSFELKGEK